MIKYYLTAGALKFASLNPTTKKMYRTAGNVLGQRRRRNAPVPAYYCSRVKRNVTLCQEFNLFKGGKMLEVGTGWVHWEALTSRLFFDFEATLYDVWDNRQFGAMLRFLTALENALTTGDLKVPGDTPRALALIRKIRTLRNFQEVYDLLGFEYVLDPQGELAGLADRSYALVVSAGVLEHVGRESAPRIARAMSRVLQPGGYCIHSINITDHLYLYDKSASPKQYLMYSEDTWKRLFENDVQYINRLQRPDWFRIFSEAGFEVVQESSDFRDVSSIRVAPQYAALSEHDRNCLTLDAVFRLKQ